MVSGLCFAGLVVHAAAQAYVGRAEVQKQIREWDELLSAPVAWLDEQGPGSVAVGDIGWIAFHTKRPIVDVIGLIDKDIARSAGGYANKDKSVIAERVFSQKADFLVVMAPRSCYEPGYPALRGLFLRDREELWRDYALTEVFSLGADGFNCVFARLGELSEPIDFERFEGPELRGWNLEGAMAVAGASFGDLPDFRHDSRVLTTWQRGQGPGLLGRASSPAFEVQADYLRFRVAGGGGAGVRVELLDADTHERLREVAGRGDLRMRPVYWDLRPFRGRRLQLRVVDEARGEFGMLFVDDLVFLNARAGAADE